MQDLSMRGFTLVETVIYIALLGVLMVGAVTTAYQLTQHMGNVSDKNTAGEEGNFVLRKLNWVLTGTSTSATITLPSPSTPYTSSLDLNRADGTHVIVRYNANNSSIELSESGGVPSSSYTPLTTVNVKVSQLQFHYLAAFGGSPAGIEASTTINGLVFSEKSYVRQ